MAPVVTPIQAAVQATPAAAATVSPGGAAATPVLPPATVDVSPAQVHVGAVTLSMSLEPARHMLAQTAVMTSDPDPAHQASAGDPALTSTALVLDGLLSLSNNLDPSQLAPADQPQAMIRHINLQVRTNEAGNPVPYLSVSMDLLLDGHPITIGLPVKPMVAAESTTPQLYYGNNLKLTQRGTYQVFIRLQPTALLGKGPAAGGPVQRGRALSTASRKFRVLYTVGVILSLRRILRIGPKRWILRRASSG